MTSPVRLSRLWILLLLSLVLAVVAPLPVARADLASPIDLRALTLTASEIGGGAELVEESDVASEELLQGDGAEIRLLRSKIVGIYERSFETRGVHARIRLAEVHTHEFAAGITASADHRPDGFPPESGTSVERAEDGRLIASTNGATGRVAVFVTAYDMGEAASIPDTELQRLTSELFLAQWDKVPSTNDIEESRVMTFRWQFSLLSGVAASVAILLFSLLGTASVTLSDRGSREWRTYSGRPPSPRREGAPRVDLTPDLRRSGRRSALISAGALAAMTALVFAVMATPFVGIWLGFGLVYVVILAVQFISARLLRTSDATLAVTSGDTTAAMILGVGQVVSTAVYLVGLMLLISGPLGILLYPTLELAPIVVGLMLMGIVVISYARRPIRFARRLVQPVVRTAIEADSRPPVMLLRSFQDDALEVAVHPGAHATAVEEMTGEAYLRFEEIIAWALWRHGPVLAVGQPGTILQPLGAARDYYGDDEWQEAVHARTGEASLIVLVVGRSPGLMWEIEQLRRKGLLGKTLFVLPPVPLDELAPRMLTLASALSMKVEALDPGDHRFPLVLQFEIDGTPRLVVSGGRDDRSYLAAIADAGVHALDQPTMSVTGPSDPWSAVPDDVSELLETFDPDNVPKKRKTIAKRMLDVVIWFT